MSRKAARGPLSVIRRLSFANSDACGVARKPLQQNNGRLTEDSGQALTFIVPRSSFNVFSVSSVMSLLSPALD